MRVIFLISLCLLSFISKAQNVLEQTDFKYMQYLLETRQYTISSKLGEKYTRLNLTKAQKDSLSHYRAWTAYYQARLPKALEMFNQQNMESTWGMEAAFFSAYLHAYLGNYSKGIEKLNSIKTDSPEFNQLINFQKAGMFLLKRDYSDFSKHAQAFDGKYFPIAKEEQLFKESFVEMTTFRNRSEFMAASLSAVIPGLGKIYAGKTGEGLAALFTVGVMGLISYENYRKCGPEHYRTLISGSLFAAFYAGNVVGSVYTLRQTRFDFYEEKKHHILFNLHIPLRYIFNVD